MLSKYIKNLFLIYFFLLIDVLMANELDDSSDTEKKYDISICAIFKDQALYLEDWIEYHLGIGVDHFYLYNIGSKDRYGKVLSPYIEKNIVTLVNWPEALSYRDECALKWALSTQIPAYENAVNFIARNETKWLVFLDINEVLELPDENIKKLLNRYDQFPGISSHSEFSDKEISNTFDVKALGDEMIEINEFPLENIDKSVANIIFKPDHCFGFSWPPYQCRFKESESCFEADPGELRVKRCINRKVVHSSCEETRKFLAGTYEKRVGSMYQNLPDFLRKLKESFSRENNEKPSIPAKK